MEHLVLLLVGIVLIVLGRSNWKGNISSIRWYNRSRISEKDIPRYGRLVGLGSIIIGISFLLAAVLWLLLEYEQMALILLAGVVVGMILFLYAQFKYNKGIF